MTQQSERAAQDEYVREVERALGRKLTYNEQFEVWDLLDAKLSSDAAAEKLREWSYDDAMNATMANTQLQ